MKPIFTIHAGEYLVGSEIEKKFKNLNVWVPTKDTGIDLLVTNSKNTKSVSFQVKFSKDFNVHSKEVLKKNTRSSGWWTFDRNKIISSKANYWVLILYSFENKASDFLIIKPKDLIYIFDRTNRKQKTIHCYITITKAKKAFETRGISRNLRFNLETSNLDNTIRDVSKYVDNWKVLNKFK